MPSSSDTVFYAAYLLLHDKEFLKHNASVRPDVFPRGSLRYLVGLSLQHWGEHRRVLTAPVVLLATENESAALRRHGAEKEQVRQVYKDLEAYAVDEDGLPMTRELSRKWLERRTTALAVEKAQEALDQGNVSEAHVHLSTAHLRVEERATGVTLASAQKILNKKTTRKGAVPMGIYELDRLWDGGVRKGELGIVAGATGTGKSMVLSKFAAAAFWHGCDVLYYTFELTPQQILSRIMAGIVEVGSVDLQGKNWEEALARAARLRGVSIPDVNIEVRGDSMTWPDIMADLEVYKEKHGHYPGMLILDSADDIAPMGRQQKVHEQLREAYTHLRMDIAQGLKMRVWTSSQFNREAIEKARVSLKNVADAYAKAMKVHYFLGFAQTQQEREHEDGPRMSLYVLKDSLHGTAGSWIELAVAFGHGANGFPGWEVERTHGLPPAFTSDDPRERDDE